jgi:exosortase
MEGERSWPTAVAGTPPREAATWQAPRWYRGRGGAFVLYSVCLTIAFIKPLTRLMVYATQSDYSYIVVVPLIVGYLVVLRDDRQQRPYTTSPAWTTAMVIIGLGALVPEFLWRSTLSFNDGLALLALSFVSLITAGAFLFFGSTWMWNRALPMSFLIFMVPMPDAMRLWLEDASVRGSTEVSAWLFSATGIPYVREEAVFWLPGIQLLVARECSGIHSSWVLFITSLLAAERTLNSTWRRLVLVAFTIPLGLVRNAVRIVFITTLCLKIGPEMIDHPIHRKGGPVFFALSLIPLFFFLYTLRRHDQPR